MDKKFFLAGLATTVINLILHSVVYFLFLKDFFQSHPAGSEEFVRQLTRQPQELVVWAMAATSLSMGFLITLIIRWSGATTFSLGLKKGFIMSALFWASVNFGLYASSNHFSLASVMADTVSSVTVMTLSAALAAWMLNRGRIGASHQSGDQRTTL